MRRSLLTMMHGLLVTTLAATLPSLSLAGETAPPKTITVTIRDHKFEATPLSIPPGQSLLFRVTNLDPTTEEFESYDMGFEVVVRPGQTILVPVSGLGKGRYDFFGDFHPGTAHATLTVH